MSPATCRNVVWCSGGRLQAFNTVTCVVAWCTAAARRGDPLDDIDEILELLEDGLLPVPLLYMRQAHFRRRCAARSYSFAHRSGIVLPPMRRCEPRTLLRPPPRHGTSCRAMLRATSASHGTASLGLGAAGCSQGSVASGIGGPGSKALQCNVGSDLECSGASTTLTRNTLLCSYHLDDGKRRPDIPSGLIE